MTTELASVKTDTQVEMVEEMIGRGTVIEARDLVEEIEMIEACLDGMHGAMIMSALQDETAIYLKDEWIEEAVEGGLHEVIETSSPSKWAAEIERKAPVHHRRRRSQPQISQTLYPSRRGKDD